MAPTRAVAENFILSEDVLVAEAVVCLGSHRPKTLVLIPSRCGGGGSS